MLYSARDYARLRRWVLLVSLLAWLALLRPAAAPPLYGSVSAPGPPTVSYCAVGASVAPGLSFASPEAWRPAWGAVEALRPVAALAGGWVLMLLAMMAPMLTQPLYHVHLSSFRRRRTRASGLFLVGYGGLWLAAGLPALAVALVVKAGAPHSYLPAALAGVVALVWQASPAKQRCLNRCHRHPPLGAFGLAADWAALRLGLEHGRWCIGSCWAAMLCSLLVPHGHLVAMAAVSVLTFCERLDPPQAPAWQWRGFKSAGLYLRHQLRARLHPSPAEGLTMPT